MKTLVMLSFLTGAVVIAQQPELILGAQMVGGPPVTGSPYSAQAVTDVTQALADGNRIELQSSSMRYRDAQGRERREEVLSGAAGTSIVFISDPVARTSYTLDQKAHTAQKIGPLPPLPPPPPPHGASIGIIYLPAANQVELLKARGLDHGALVREPVK